MTVQENNQTSRENTSKETEATIRKSAHKKYQLPPDQHAHSKQTDRQEK